MQKVLEYVQSRSKGEISLSLKGIRTHKRINVKVTEMSFDRSPKYQLSYNKEQVRNFKRSRFLYRIVRHREREVRNNEGFPKFNDRAYLLFRPFTPTIARKSNDAYLSRKKNMKKSSCLISSSVR